METFVLFPHQLFRDNPARVGQRLVFLIEDELYFRQYAFHRQKLVLHCATMRMHAAHLASHGVPVRVVQDLQPVFAAQPEALHYIDPVDDWLERRLLARAREAGVRAVRHDTPMFLSTESFLEEQFAGRGAVRMQHFYAAQRKSMRILMDGQRPVGGRWSFDTENRKRLPRGMKPPALPRPAQTADVLESMRRVEREFRNNPGQASDFAYPATYEDARAWLDDFIEQRLVIFGPYEDAMAAGEPHLFHSVLTPVLNIGLLTPREVVDAVLARTDVPLASLEGFVRQVIGWREFVRGAYVHRGRRQRKRNFFGHTRPLPSTFWTGDTGIAPLDIVIRRVLRHAYAHHIERLMVLGNFMLLARYHPDDVYRWFMELFIDAYDWVMVPNVYGMALFADGGLVTTKPYISGSAYLRRMSDFPAGPWCDTWDALYWSFVDAHREVFAGNPRLAGMVRQFERMDPGRRELLRARAAEALQ